MKEQKNIGKKRKTPEFETIPTTFRPYKTVTPKLVLILYVSVLVFSVIYYFVGTTFFNSPLSYFDYLVFTSILAVIIVGGYQLYFWTEYNNDKFESKCYKIGLDDKIPHLPWVVWIYSFSYYAIIGLVIVSINSLQQGLYYVFGGLLILSIQCLFFYFFPSTVPKDWRKYESNSFSKRFLKFVQKIDSGRNCMPSMHMSIATYVSLILVPVFSYYSYLIILFIAASCLFVKQHQILDLLPGVAIGFLVYIILF